MKTINLNKELGPRLTHDFLSLSGLNSVSPSSFFLYKDFFKKTVEELKNKDRKLYTLIQRNLIESEIFESITEIQISKV